MRQRCKRLLAAGLTAMLGACLCSSPAWAGKPSAPVPPTQEIVVLDPNVDPNGNPAVIPQQRGFGSIIDIPPAVLVHRFYYTGDRSFQAQMLPGGPCVVVVNHPHSGERVYVPVVLPPGAPRVKYCSNTIEYDFSGVQSVCITFGLLNKSTVTYAQQGTKIGKSLHDCGAKMCARAKELLDRTGIPDACRNLKQVCSDTKDNIAAGIKTANQNFIINPISNGVRMLPGANAILPPPSQVPTSP